MFFYIEGWLILVVLLFCLFVCSFVLFFGVTLRYPAVYDQNDYREYIKFAL